MVFQKLVDLRSDDRDARFAGNFSLSLHASDGSGRTIPIRPLDVSKRGLGFFAREPLKQGTFFTLVVGAIKYRVELAYSNNHLGIDDLFRCGLFLREADGNLHEACNQFGLLADEHRTNS